MISTTDPDAREELPLGPDGSFPLPPKRQPHSVDDLPPIVPPDPAVAKKAGPPPRVATVNKPNGKKARKPFDEQASIAEQNAADLLAIWCEHGSKSCPLEPGMFPSKTHSDLAQVVIDLTESGSRGWPEIAAELGSNDVMRVAFMQLMDLAAIYGTPANGIAIAQKLRAFHVEKEKIRIGQAIAKRTEAGDEYADLLTELAGLDARKDKVAYLMEARAFCYDQQPPRPIPLFTLAGMTLCTAGNITNVQAPPKAGKSAVIDAMLAAVLNGNRVGADTLGFDADNERGFALIHIDTEQSRFDADSLVRRSLRRARIEQPPIWFKSYSVADLTIADRREVLRLSMNTAMKEHGGIFAVLIDGIGDLCADPNDSAESFALVQDLHTAAISCKCTIVTVLHENPGSEQGKTRGHLGSQLERKAETNLRLAKDASGITAVWADKARHCYLPKEQGPCFAWNQEKQMHASCGTAGEIKRAANRDRFEADADKVFNEQDSFRHSELMDAIGNTFDLKERAAKARIQKWTAEGIIRKDAAGNYQLSNP